MRFGFTDLSRDEGDRLVFGWKNLFLTLWREVYTLIRANLCFLLCCLPIVTIPPALTALYGVCVDAIRGQKCQVGKTFLKTIKTQFLSSWALFLGLAGVETVSCVAAWFYFTRGNWMLSLLGLMATAIGVVVLFMIPYCFCMLARVRLPLKQVVKNGFLLSFLNLKFSICSTVLAIAIVLVLVLWWLYLLPLILLIGEAFVAYLTGYFSLYGLQKFVLTEEL